ncbi:MAG: hypothetical protein ACKPKO_50020, partial [Candidatus Fonsibacter sp.]
DTYTDGMIKNKGGLSVGDQTAVNTWTSKCSIYSGTGDISTFGLISGGGTISSRGNITATGNITSSGAFIRWNNNINKLSCNHCNHRKTYYTISYGLLYWM